MAVVYVGGVPASGKSTNSRSLAEILGADAEYIGSGKIKHPFALSMFGKRLPDLNQDETYRINERVFDEYIKKFGGTYILDSRFASPYDGGFVRIISPRYADKIDFFVLFEAAPEEVLGRRLKRLSRGEHHDYDSLELSFILKEIDAERIEAERISRDYRKPLEVLDTTDKLKGEVPEELKEILEKQGLLIPSRISKRLRA